VKTKNFAMKTKNFANRCCEKEKSKRREKREGKA
jgi:hypothetical protein